MEQYKINLLKLAAKHNFSYELLWNETLEFSVTCNEFFAYACADAEDITSQEDVDTLELAIKDLLEADPEGDVWAVYLFVARKRKMRPLSSNYEWFPIKLCRLFDECGPEREDRNLFSELKEGIDDLEKRRPKKDLDIHGELE